MRRLSILALSLIRLSAGRSVCLAFTAFGSALIALATPLLASYQLRLVDNYTPGYYNDSIGTLLNGTSEAFPIEGDPNIDFTTAPDLSAAAGVLDDWLSPNFPTNGSFPHWSNAPVAIYRQWTPGSETAIVYPLDVPAAGYTDLTVSIGVDNGVFVWLDGVFLGGALRQFDAIAGEHRYTVPQLAGGRHYLQVLRADHGGNADFIIEVTATASGERPPAAVYNLPPSSSDAVAAVMEWVPRTNPNYFRQDQYSVVPNLKAGAPGVWSVVSLGNSGGNQPSAGGPLSVLSDGLAPADLYNQAAGGVFSTTGVGYGLLYDLGAASDVTSITTYSAGSGFNVPRGEYWLGYQVWGAETLLDIVDGQDPYATGWTRLANYAPGDYGADLGKKGGAVAIHLTSRNGAPMGRFRYILFGMGDLTQTVPNALQAMMSEISIETVAEPTPVFSYTIQDGGATITGYTGAGGVTVIPSELGGLPVVAIGDSAFEYSPITELTLPEGLQTIGARAFYVCNRLARVQLPASLREIGAEAFALSMISSITIPASVQAIGDRAFYADALARSANSISPPPMLQGALFLGNAPLMGSQVFGPGWSDLPSDMTFAFFNRFFLTSVTYLPGASGFTADSSASLETLHVYNLYYPSQVSVPTWRGYPVGPMPALSIAAADADLLLSWPSSAKVWELQSTTDLTDPDSWTAVPIAPAVVGETYQLREPLPGAAKFYRLKILPLIYEVPYYGDPMGGI